MPGTAGGDILLVPDRPIWASFYQEGERGRLGGPYLGQEGHRDSEVGRLLLALSQ